VKEKMKQMKCSIEKCRGEYKKQDTIHTVRYKGKVIDHVPAEVCSVCGDVLLSPKTTRKIEALLQKSPCPVNTAPLYEFVA